MKIFGWMQNKLNGRLGTKKQNFISVNNHRQQEPNRNEEFSDWPHGLLAIGTFGNKDMKEDSKNNNSVQENLSQYHLQQLTLEEVEKLQNEINLLLHKQVGSNSDGTESDQTDKITLDGNPSSEDDRTNDDNVCSVDSNDRDYHLQDSTSVVLGKGTALGSTINKKSLSYLLKKMLICRGGFTPTPCLRDQVPESRMEKILRAILHKKIYPQNPSSAFSTKKYLENKQKPSRSAIANEDDEINQKDDKGSKWVKTDSEYIVLEI